MSNISFEVSFFVFKQFLRVFRDGGRGWRNIPPCVLRRADRLGWLTAYAIFRVARVTLMHRAAEP